MSPSQWFMTADETRLSILLRDAANLDLQLYELNKLRYQVRQAQRADVGRVDGRSDDACQERYDAQQRPLGHKIGGAVCVA